MTCKNCDPKYNYPGRMIKVASPDWECPICADCGDKIFDERKIIDMAESIRYASQSRWDEYFLRLCETVSNKSPCLSRTIGVVLTRHNSVVATGYNGPARGVPHCGHERLKVDESLQKAINSKVIDRRELDITCPRQLMNYKTGKGLEWCLASHAEQNVIANAAMLGVNVYDTTLYMNCVLPCKNCMSLLINAGISEIVVTSLNPYDDYSKYILNHSSIKVREFDI
uniref:Putative CMP/dCMP deaminase zinc-binding n=1 Tax=viral metagenome TaxID=1070528 RepID=A0A6M3JZ95_9ZZZZ